MFTTAYSKKTMSDQLTSEKLCIFITLISKQTSHNVLLLNLSKTLFRNKLQIVKNITYRPIHTPGVNARVAQGLRLLIHTHKV